MTILKDITCSRCGKECKTYMTYTEEEIENYKCMRGLCFEKGLEKK